MTITQTRLSMHARRRVHATVTRPYTDHRQHEFAASFQILVEQEETDCFLPRNCFELEGSGIKNFPRVALDEIETERGGGLAKTPEHA
jgi:hypothetical protein